ncbi:hypothetical protein FisN_2Hh580 [Fistulifera solaris]|uniref:Uncharacterized protein n=1 Tax=Fistulifera solaris TaxID=1519565 RepID=A0A1Z5JGC7_FISSO|nr:hypothetical protein FisN_2Hh580 [Fistulifera solaris]|eukprot:GAX13067.1 hypothetical protein FisN_2Hh580 [Fistulifera solaris]
MTTSMECIQACPADYEAKFDLLLALIVYISGIINASICFSVFFLCYYTRGQLVSDASTITGEIQSSPLSSTPRKAELQTVSSGSVPAVAPAVADATAQVGKLELEMVSAGSVPVPPSDVAKAPDSVGGNVTPKTPRQSIQSSKYEALGSVTRNGRRASRRLEGRKVSFGRIFGTPKNSKKGSGSSNRLFSH